MQIQAMVKTPYTKPKSPVVRTPCEPCIVPIYCSGEHAMCCKFLLFFLLSLLSLLVFVVILITVIVILVVTSSIIIIVIVNIIVFFGCFLFSTQRRNLQCVASSQTDRGVADLGASCGSGDRVLTKPASQVSPRPEETREEYGIVWYGTVYYRMNKVE